jgi:FkbM family methyltransferase
MYSFSQNFEDVYIRRAFSDVESGFYIDVGAFDPVVDSITKMLYDSGWHGINIEPGPTFNSFSERTRDIHLSFAIGSSIGEIDFYYNSADPGASTVVPRQSDHDDVSKGTKKCYRVPVTTLDWIIENFAENEQIHFLKIDIEGGEWDVIRNTSWDRHRPELLITESTLPYSNIRRDAQWVRHLRKYNYKEVFFDGINTYFLRSESLFRQEAFSRPVNIIDGVKKFDPILHGAASSISSDGERRLKFATDAIILATEKLLKEASVANVKSDATSTPKVLREAAVAAEPESADVSARLNHLEQQLEEQKRLADDLRLIDKDRLAALRDLSDVVARGLSAYEHASPSRSNSGETLLDDLRNQVESWLNAQNAALADHVEQRSKVAEEFSRLEELSRSLRNSFHEIEIGSSSTTTDLTALIDKLIEDIEVVGSAWSEAQARIAELDNRVAETDRHRTETKVLSGRLRNARRSRDRVAALGRELQAKLGEQSGAGNSSVQEENRPQLDRYLLEQAIEQDRLRKSLTSVVIEKWCLDRRALQAQEEARAVNAIAEERARLLDSMQRRLEEATSYVMTLGQAGPTPRKLPVGLRLLRFLRRPYSLVSKADNFRDAGRYVEAAHAYGLAFAALPERADLCVQQANMLKDAGMLDEADACYRKALSVLPNNPDIHLQMGHLHHIAGRRYLAEEAYRRAGDGGASRADVEQAMAALAKIDS